MSRASFSGLDLYARDRDQWRWVGMAGIFPNRRPKMQLVAGLPARRRSFQLYLPLRNPLVRLEVGVPRKAKFRPIPPRLAKPIVYYGSSITHGAYASRPGMVHASILGRRVDHPVVNLGFSGQAKMDLPMANLLSELDAGVFVIDPLGNMDAALIHERAEAFLNILCRAHPRTPLLLIEDCPFANAWAKPQVLQTHREKWRALTQVYRALRNKGHDNIRYVRGSGLLGDDNEGSVDGIHPNDLGYMRMAEQLLPVLREVMPSAPAEGRRDVDAR